MNEPREIKPFPKAMTQAEVDAARWQLIECAPYDTLVLCYADNWEWPRVLRFKNGLWEDETTEDVHKPQYWVRIPAPPISG